MEEDARALVHGDDFGVLGDEVALEAIDKLLKSRYDCVRTAKLGSEPGDDKEALFLNRVIRIVDDPEEMIEIEGDKWHAEIIVEELGLNTSAAKAVSTPREKVKAEIAEKNATLPPLPGPEASLYRSLTM